MQTYALNSSPFKEVPSSVNPSRRRKLGWSQFQEGFHFTQIVDMKCRLKRAVTVSDHLNTGIRGSGGIDL